MTEAFQEDRDQALDVERLREAMVAKAAEYRSAKRLRPVLSSDDEKWNARMDGAENALSAFAAALQPATDERKAVEP